MTTCDERSVPDELYQCKNWGRWAGAIVISVFLTNCSANNVIAEQQLQRFQFLQIRMGIPINITVYAGDEPTANEAVKAAYARFRALDRVMSDYDPDSELMQLCQQAELGETYHLSSDLHTVLVEAQRLSRQTDGAFDVTVAPVVKLWRIARRRKALPDPDRLRDALNLVGYQHIVLGCNAEQKPTIAFQQQGMRIDLGAIAKGFAADEALNVLKSHGITRALIDAGGDIVAGDPPPQADAWRIEVEKMNRSNQSETQRPLIVHLKNAAIATSGDAYQFIEIDGIRYSHIVNPKTGLGLTTPSSVTVIAPTGMQADSLASAISVLGAEAGLKLLQDYKHCHTYIVQQPSGVANPVITRSPGFPALSE